MCTVWKINHVLAGILLVISTAFQSLALLGGVLLNKNNSFVEDTPWLVPVWGGMLVLLIVAYVLLLKLGERFPWQPILFFAALVGAFAAFVVVTTLRDALPDRLNVTGSTQGLTTWKLLYRHVSSVLVGVLIAVEAVIKWIVDRREHKKAMDTANDPAASTIGLDSFAGNDNAYQKPKKLKRSLRKKAKENAEQEAQRLSD